MFQDQGSWLEMDPKDHQTCAHPRLLGLEDCYGHVRQVLADMREKRVHGKVQMALTHPRAHATVARPELCAI